MTAYFDDRNGWLRDLREVAKARYDDEGYLVSAHYDALDARCNGLLLADPMGAGVDFFLRGLAEAWEASGTELMALTIVHAIERDLVQEMEAVKVACTLAEIGAGASLALHRWTLNHAGDRRPEDLAQAARRVSDLCNAAHSLMREVARIYRCSDNPRDVVHAIWEAVR